MVGIYFLIFSTIKGQNSACTVGIPKVGIQSLITIYYFIIIIYFVRVLFLVKVKVSWLMRTSCRFIFNDQTIKIFVIYLSTVYWLSVWRISYSIIDWIRRYSMEVLVLYWTIKASILPSGVIIMLFQKWKKC